MSKYVLIVDDNPSDLLLTSFLIEKQEYLPIRAKDGYEALDKMAEFPINAFVIDLQMPKMPGLELIKRIRSQSEYAKMPILVLSARKEEKDVRVAIQLGANDYIIKPADPAIFFDKMQSTLGKSTGWAEAPIAKENNQGSILAPIELISISEVGITYIDKYDAKVGDLRIINAPLFEENNLLHLQVSIRTVTTVDNKFKIKASFVGLPEGMLKKIRLLCKDIWTQQKINQEAAS